ncbi:hypothetical protein GCM10009821_10240 [Aeromicrobium halocynthiae]|uniref:CopC domain-containing protein n=1 Tax=Aeromicrobium halocynthiae TaxID=560557 RepID=A0ABN2VVB2_9ACTN
MPTTRTGRSVLVLLLATLPLLWGTSATAHSALIDSDPEADSSIEALPERITLTFNEPLNDIGPAMIVRQGEETVAELEPQIDGPVASAESPTDLPPGDYDVVWRVVSADGHPVSGTISFTLAGDASAPDETAPEPGSETTEETAPESAPTDEAVADDDTEPAAASSTPWLILGAVALLAAAALVLLLLRRRRDNDDTSDDTAAPTLTDPKDPS